MALNAWYKRHFILVCSSVGPILVNVGTLGPVLRPLGLPVAPVVLEDVLPAVLLVRLAGEPGGLVGIGRAAFLDGLE